MAFNYKDYILDFSKNPASWEFYNKQHKCHWNAKKFKFLKDKSDYEKAPENIKRLFHRMLGFLLVGDEEIYEDILPFIEDAMKEKDWAELSFLAKQQEMEVTHLETYTNSFNTLVPENLRNGIIEEIFRSDALKKKCEWLHKCGSEKSRGLRYFMVGIGEGIFFISIFAIIYIFRKLDMLVDFVVANEEISRDETIHRDHKAYRTKQYLTENEHSEAYRILKEAVELEIETCKFVLKEPVISEQTDKDMGLTWENLKKYVENIADLYLIECGLAPIYKHEKVRLKWMEDINLDQKANFYEIPVVGTYRSFDTTDDNTLSFADTTF